MGENVLKCIGFVCKWDRPSRSATLTAPPESARSVKLNTNPTPYYISIFSSDTLFYYNGFCILALNVGNGESIIDVNALAERILY